ncbi:4Fe-4S dicluster domain-containing protein, partial [bacterium]|nr:4Fe-4S dicluster domain-containing protein [bacterium]
KYIEIIELLKKKVTNHIQIEPIGDFYPAGDEVTLVYLTTGRIVQPGDLPISIGCIVQNVETVFNIAINQPVVEKFITIAGEVENPVTIKAPVGTSYSQLLSQVHITTRNYRIITGGVMMGRLENDLSRVVTKTVSGLIVLPADHYCVQMYERFNEPKNTIRIAKAGCDQCSFCTELCPRYLLGHPVRPETAMRNVMFSPQEAIHVHSGNIFCCQCNLCTLYSCPEGLDPRGATVLEKSFIMQNNQLHWEGFPVSAHPMMNYRKVPTKKLMQRLGVMQYQNNGPLTDMKIIPERVRILLKQHVGTPASPVVNINQSVKKYELIAEAKGSISANVHASIDGQVTEINENEIVIQRI